MVDKPFWEKPLESLSDEEWEALCDGCGQCCLNKLEDANTGKIYNTRVACDLLNLSTYQCSNYCNRRKFVPDCIKLTYEMIKEIEWLPKTCAYMLRFHNEPLPKWHPLLSNDPTSVAFAIQLDKFKLVHDRETRKSLQYYIIPGELGHE